MAHFALILLVSLVLLCNPRLSLSSEMYFLGGNRVLLYKIINWWYDAPKEEAHQLCGDELRYENTEKARLDVVEDDSSMTISLEDFGSLFSVLQGCENCPTSYSVKASWINSEYFANSSATLFVEESSFTNSYTIRLTGVEDTTLESLLGDIQGWKFTLTGRLEGLQNGKITLNKGGDQLKKCAGSKSRDQSHQPAYFSVFSKIDESPLMKFTISAD